MSDTSMAGRRPWEAADNETLMALWDAIGSVLIIARLMSRSPSSIQTQASRLGLPPRGEGLSQARRKWGAEDDELLESLEFDHTDEDGLLDVLAVAREMGRGPDQVIARLETMRPDENVMDRIRIPLTEARAAEAKTAARHSSSPRDKCLKCRKPFRSEGRHNWVCVRCKRGEDWLSA